MFPLYFLQVTDEHNYKVCVINIIVSYRIAGNFRKVLFLKILKMVKHFRKYFFEIAR